MPAIAIPVTIVMSGIPMLLQIDQPIPGQEIHWVAALLAGAIPVLFWALMKAKDQLIEAYKGIGEKATTELSKTIESLRTINDAVERRGQDTTTAFERQSQLMATMAAEVHRMGECLARIERNVDRIDERDRLGGERRSKGGDG